jgi:5-methylcytosine-specific restriction endonuclease McrA
VKAVSDKRRKRDAVYPKRREQVWARGNGMCEFCDYRSMEQVHHIAGRGGPDPHRLENLIGLCRDCHEKAHAFPEWARKFGLMRTRHSQGT